MSLATVFSRAIIGTDAPEITVEVYLSRGLPAFFIVGLPEAVVRESKDRVRGAIINSNFTFPRQRITVNLAPADLPKEGARFDLPIALGVLAASGQVPLDGLKEFVVLGELALSGACRHVRGGLIAALSIRHRQQTLILPQESAQEAALVENTAVNGVSSLLELAGILNGMGDFQPLPARAPAPPPRYPDFADVVGQPMAKRALEIAAAGFHSVLMSGPPGAGKTMLASRLPGILPMMNPDEALESAAITSLSTAGFNPQTWRYRPFRSPHHSISGAALIGGGSFPRPGEISLAHNGVLFLDELPEFDRKVLEHLREPLEAGAINISRAAQQCRFLARFLFIAASNPCPCGYLGSGDDRCRCLPDQVARYRAKISGPLLDRIDMQIKVPSISIQSIHATAQAAESSDGIRQRVITAQQRQFSRQGKLNSMLGADTRHWCKLGAPEIKLLDDAMRNFGVSSRGYQRILRVARTIADLDGLDSIGVRQLGLAIQLRNTGATSQ